MTHGCRTLLENVCIFYCPHTCIEPPAPRKARMARRTTQITMMSINSFISYLLKKQKMMKKETWKMVIQIAISILTAIATSLGVTSCMQATTAPPYYIYRWGGLFYFRSLRSWSLRSLRISVFQKSLNIPLSYKIRLNQVHPANKIHPYNHFSEFFFVFLQIYCADMELSMAYPPRLQAHHYQMI